MAWFRKGNCINAESNLGCERKSTSEIECSFANNLNPVTIMVMGWLILLTLAGCGEVAPSKPVSSSTALRTMKSSMRKGDWQAASESADQVIAAYHENASVIALVAQVRHENGDPELASQLLMQACRVDDYSVPARVNQAVVSLLAVGKLSEVFGFLEEALDHQPEQHEYRRLLYDLYMGTENRLLGIPHGRKLVLQRQFDLELLKNLSNTERRTQEVQPLKEILSRNAADKRPLIGSAKIEFDEGNYEGAIDLLLSIIEVHPDHIPSQAILGRAYAAARRFDELSVWAGKQSQPIAASPDYWIAIGDWSRSQNDHESAARAYWEGTQADPDVLEAWSKLNMAIQSMPPGTVDVSPRVLKAMQTRVASLSRLSQLKNRFERTGNISRAIVVDIVETLVQLGRAWEAEAWAAIAFRLPEDDSVDLERVRADVIRNMSSDTKWQMTANYPEFDLDLSQLSMPEIGKLTRVKQSDGGTIAAANESAIGLRLANHASQREVVFHGHTSKKLDQAGIMLHQTLGCGGGTIDFDLDGWSDLYLIAAGGNPSKQDSDENALMRNLDGAFQSVSEVSATNDRGYGQGVAVGDLNEDGFPDLMVLNYGPNKLFVNNGDGTFTDASEKLAVNDDDDWSTSAAIADMDGDGLSDMIVTNYCAGLEPSTTACPMKNSDVARSCSPMVFKARADLFLKSTENGNFADRTQQWGCLPDVVGRGLGIVVGTFDAASGLDALIANDMTNNHYWSRSGADNSFKMTESAMIRGLGADDRAIAQGSMGIATGDLDRDGDLDFYVTNFDKEYNTVHLQQNVGAWRDETLQMGLLGPTTALVGFGSEAVDLDNDGNLEIVVANGHVDMFSRDDQRSVYAQPFQVFQRNSAGGFEAVEEQMKGEYITTPHVARALWTLDANRDGKVDLAVTHQTEPVALLMNESSPTGHWICLELKGKTGSRDAIGTQLVVTHGQETWTTQKVAGHGYLCSNESLVRIGLGELPDQATVDLKLTWPDGTVQVITGMECDTDWLVVQGEQAFRR